MSTLSAVPAAHQSEGFARGLEGFRGRAAVELQSSGIAELDAVLEGGFPRGSIVELCGSPSSGRTSLALSLLAQATGRQEACAFVDVSDCLDPYSLAAAGVDLARLLWIRCGETPARAPRQKLSSLHAPQTLRKNAKPAKKTLTGSFWQHPRDQMRGIENAIHSVIQPAADAADAHQSARIHVVARCAGEQVERDRELPRRGIHTRRPWLPSPEKEVTNDIQRDGIARRAKPWTRMEQALRSTDLLLHSGGWGVVVMDLGGISWVHARRINLNMWFRFRRAVENTPTILVLLGEESCAKSCASLVLRCRRQGENWRGTTQSNDAAGVVTLQGFEVQGDVIRSRMKPQSADSARWQTRTLWANSF
jgi:recombination protein RecA